MARQAPYKFELPDGRKVGVGFKIRNGVYYVRFQHPADPTKYVVTTTERTTEGAAYQRAAQVVLKMYCPQAAKTSKATWDAILEDMARSSGLRPRSLEVYESTVRILRQVVPTAGPHDVTPDVAHLFRQQYATGTFTRSKKSTAKKYKRSPKTVENAIRRLSGLWSKYLVRHGYAQSNPWAAVPRPTIPKKVVKIPEEDTVRRFFGWLAKRYPSWELPRLFVEVKMLAGCRTMDLCLAKSENLKGGALTIEPDHDKTHRERVVPLPPDLAKKLKKIAGPTWLWESYAEGAKVYRPGTRNRDDFSPRTLYWCVNNLFREWNEENPDRKLNPHDLRRRTITLTTLATGSVDQTAEAIGIDPSTARRYYLDAKRAFDGTELLKRMANVLRPKEATKPASK
jgi:integrase